MEIQDTERMKYYEEGNFQSLNDSLDEVEMKGK